jgi:hypothetical protein
MGGLVSVPRKEVGDGGYVGSALPLYPEEPPYQALIFLHKLGFGVRGDSVVRDIADDVA